MLAGMDYLSYTVFDGDTAHAQSETEYSGALSYLSDYAARYGAIPEPRTRYGYAGYVYSGMYVGRKDGADGSSVWVSLAGSVAHHYCVHRLPRISPLARARRMDVQVTVPVPYAETLSDIDLAIGGIADALSRVYPLRSITLIQGYGRGSTLYIGSASSNVRLVVYNKTAQDPSVGGLMWRLECRMRDERAEEAFVGLRAGASPVSYLAKEARQYSLLYGHFRAVLDGLSDVPAADMTPSLADVDNRTYRTLRWLETQVSPAISRLLNYQNVNADMLRAILGLVE